MIVSLRINGKNRGTSFARVVADFTFERKTKCLSHFSDKMFNLVEFDFKTCQKSCGFNLSL